ncbi:MAG: MBL fold metallo-hydrolase [Deltaproteobacteria bacterium]|nr:MBL fold metallo-hydrolase [Deltaproteobacteria bacterium]
MILEQTGKICDGLYSTGYHFLPAFLLASATPVLFDAGVAAMGPYYLRDIETYLGRTDTLGYLLLTHSHYDHCGSIPFLKEKIPGLKIGATAHAAKILQKPSVVEMMRTLNNNFAKVFGDLIENNEDIPFNAVEVDLLLKDGDELDFGEGWTVRVIETPGHTKDSLSYYIPRIKATIAGEAAGVFHNDGINPQFSSSYSDYITSLEKLTALDMDILALGHRNILTGDDIGRYLRDSIETTVSFKENIDRCLDRFSGDREKVVETIFGEIYDETVLMQQDKTSFLLNLRAQVRVVTEGK